MGEVRRSNIVSDAANTGTTSVAPGATVDTVFNVAEQDSITVVWMMTNADGANDLSDADVYPMVNGEIMPTVLTPEVIESGAFVGTTAAVVKRYDVRALGDLNVRVTNADAAARDTMVSVFSYWS